MLITGFVIAAVLSVMLLTKTAELRYQRDVNRMVYNDNLGVLSEVKSKLGMTGDSLKALLNESPAEAANVPYIVVSMADHRLWYKQGREILFEAPVATGSGKELVGGYWLWQVRSISEAIEWLKRSPFDGGTYEIRQVLEMDGM